MSKVNGKNKGNTYERKVSLILSERFATYTGIEKAFRRNQDSGSFWGATNQKRINEYDTSKAIFGDIVCPDNFKYSIECKHYKTAPTFKSIVDGKVSQWDGWISQATQDAINSKKKLLLIIKYNNVDEFVFIDEQMENKKPIIEYNGLHGYKLSDFLSMEDSYYFD